MRLFSFSTFRTSALATLAAGILLGTPQAGGAAGVAVVDGTITYTAGADEANDLELLFEPSDDGSSVVFRDGGATISPGDDCRRVDGGVACDDTAIRPLSLHLGNRSDRLAMDDCIGDDRRISVWGSRGNDVVSIGSCVGAYVTVNGGAHDDRIATSLNWSRGSTLYGGDGNDALNVREGGYAFLYGGPGHDDLGYTSNIYDPEAPTEDVKVYGDSGNDTISPAPWSFDPRTVFAGTDGKDTLSFAGWGEGEVWFDWASCALCDLETVVGSPYDDTIFGDAGPNTIRSGDGNDTVDARGGTDYVYSGAGDDAVTANDGTWDTIRCGDGLADTVFADRRESLGECEIVHR